MEFPLVRSTGTLTVHIDGIRIYDPAGTEVEAYKAFNEYKPTFKNIRVLVENGSALNLILDVEKHKVKSAKPTLVSPINETYIAANGSVAFTVSGDCSAVHMSLKSPSGKPIIVKINGEQLKDGSGNGITVTHTTELYYDITEYVGANGEVSVTCELAGTTTFIIAQRIASVMDADRVMVLDDGKLVAFDTPERLLETNDIYKEVYESQMKGAEAK